jgi:ribosomal protein S18 acetylase RimI-like enzyme
MSSIIEIITYQPEHQPWFEKLNRDWIEKYFRMEAIDELVLQAPDEHIIQKGGMIFMAFCQKEIAGTAALKFVEQGVYEFTKMGVDKKFQGKKIGEMLSQVAIQYAKDKKAKKIVLYSNTKLIPAISLYRKLGFSEVPVDGPYERCDIKMELSLSNSKKFKFAGIEPAYRTGRRGVIGLL